MCESVKEELGFFFLGSVGGKAKPLKQPKADKKEYDEVWFSILKLGALMDCLSIYGGNY